MSHRYWHEVCFSGPEDVSALIEAGEKAGYKFESGRTETDETFVGTAVQRDQAEQELAALRARLADRRGEPSD